MRVFSILTILIILCGLSACSNNAYVPNDYVDSEEHWDKEGFQDYTDFCIYKYDSIKSVENNLDYTKVTAGDIKKLKGYFDNFESWMKAKERQHEYHFDNACISEGDYCRIITKEGASIGNGSYGKYDNYTVCFFDVETLTMYYIHSSI